LRFTFSVEKCVPVISSAFSMRQTLRRNRLTSNGHVGAVLAVEDQRKRVAVFEAEQHERGQTFGDRPRYG
jgi:hypothetical protein